MKKYLIILFFIIGLSGCIPDPETILKGLVQFDSYNTGSEMQEVIYDGGQIKFYVVIQLAGSSQNLDADVKYHVLDGNTKITDGTVKVNQNLDGGLGMFWGGNEEAVSISTTTYSGKTLTVYLDPDNKHTGDMYTSQTYVDLYKKATVTIP